MEFDDLEDKNNLLEYMHSLRYELKSKRFTKEELHQSFIGVRDYLRVSLEPRESSPVGFFIVAVDNYPDRDLEELETDLYDAFKMVVAAPIKPPEKDDECDCQCDNYYDEYIRELGKRREAEKRIAELEKQVAMLKGRIAQAATS